MKHFLLALITATTLFGAFAQAAPTPPLVAPTKQLPYIDSGHYRIHFSTFTSDFLQPATAASLNFSRAKNQLLINVAVTKKDAAGQYSLGLSAAVSGTATNLMQQQKRLQFTEVNEPSAVYYLAPFRFSNEEMIHFALTIDVDGEQIPVKFSRKLYVND